MSAVPGQGWAQPVFQLGERTLEIPMSVHAVARSKLVAELRKTPGGIEAPAGVVLIRGGAQKEAYDTDIEELFRQDSWFNYLFGVMDADFFGAVLVPSGKSILFMPRVEGEYIVVKGKVQPPQYYKELYAVDEVLYKDELFDWLASVMAKERTAIHLLHGQNTDSGSTVTSANFMEEPGVLHQLNQLYGDLVDTSPRLHHALSMARTLKSEHELVAMRYCAWVASNAHVSVMRMIKEAQYGTADVVPLMEYDLEAHFHYQIYRKGGCRRLAYTAICACGPSGAVLHYGHAGAPNDRQLLETDMALLDLGADFHGYVSDITCSFPISGKFTADQRTIFEGVLNAQRAVYAIFRPGTSYTDCHQAAERCILAGLVKAGVLHPHTHESVTASSPEDHIEELMSVNMGARFMPHGLGHFIGCDTHDVGGYLSGTPERSALPGLKKLRTARILEENMVLTVEPGCYFIDYLLDEALADPLQQKYFNNAVLSRFRGFGGVRLEDVVAVTTGAPFNLTTCPRTVEEVESVMAGGQWPPATDAAPELCRQWGKLAPKGKGMMNITLK